MTDKENKMDSRKKQKEDRQKKTAMNSHKTQNDDRQQINEQPQDTQRRQTTKQ
jgi:hypothetical protein